MAGSLSNYLENALFQEIFKGVGYSSPTVYIALSTADPTEDGSGLAEPSDGYARKSTSTSDWTVATNTVTNANDLEFAEASGSWGTISHAALYDAISGGNMLVHFSLDTPKAVGSGDTARFKAGDINGTID